jgi:hypothetical protein
VPLFVRQRIIDATPVKQFGSHLRIASTRA